MSHILKLIDKMILEAIPDERIVNSTEISRHLKTLGVDIAPFRVSLIINYRLLHKFVRRFRDEKYNSWQYIRI